eukprot:171452-Rhodomonas_salina.2
MGGAAKTRATRGWEERRGEEEGGCRAAARYGCEETRREEERGAGARLFGAGGHRPLKAATVCNGLNGHSRPRDTAESIARTRGPGTDCTEHVLMCL